MSTFMTCWGEVKSAMRVHYRTSLSCLGSIPFCQSSSGAGKSDLDVMDVHVTRQNLSLLLPKKHSTNIQRKNGKQEKSKAIFDLQETPESSDDIPSKIEKVSKKNYIYCLLYFPVSSPICSSSISFDIIRIPGIAQSCAPAGLYSIVQNAGL